MKVETVLIGFHDPRIDDTAPYGFVLKAGDRITVHHRADLDMFNLPKLFRFTAKKLPAIVMTATRKAGKVEQLHDFLMKHCFNGAGCFRCWLPIEDEISPSDLDGYTLAIRELVDGVIAKYAQRLEEHERSCSPDWHRLPRMTPPALPSVTGVPTPA